MQKLKASRVRIKENCQTPTDLFLQGGARLRAGSPFRHAPLTNKEAGGYYVRAGWSSLVARRAHNPEVEGSNPSPATTKIDDFWCFRRASRLLTIMDSG
jgi:hypothetical protein